MMRYNNDNVRRRDRLMDESRAVELIKTAEYGFLAMISAEGKPYGIPLNYVWDGDHSLYIHCAPEGRKLQALAIHPEVTFCIVGRTHLLPNKFTTEYESVLLSGRARIDLSEEEKMNALHLLIAKLSPNDQEIGAKYAQKSFHRVDIIRIDIDEYSAKRKYVKTAD